MHQFASTILSLLLSPWNWIIILLIAGWIFKKRAAKRCCFIFAVCLFIVFGNSALLNLYARWWQPKPVTLSTGITYSCGIVTGGFGSPDAQGRGYFNISSDRFIQTLLLYQTGKISHILISGGNGKSDDASFREAHWAKKQFIAAGVPDSVIYTEDRSDNTADNAVNSKRLLDSLHFPPPYLLITSAFHMPRAKLIFERTGLHVIPYPCNYTDGRGPVTFSDFVPRPSSLLDWERYLKESFAYLWYKVR
jgi:uncharacterized SAM-binding protein YcdF (DUF218 family)